MCTNCTRGHTGPKCDECSDGFFGEPKYNNPNQYCTECTCNGNIGEFRLLQLAAFKIFEVNKTMLKSLLFFPYLYF